jgi:valyl-tRNA synthetase
MLQPYPQVLSDLIDETAHQEITWLKNIMLAIRNIRGEMNIPPHKKVTIFIHHASEQTQDRFLQFLPLLSALCKIETIEWLQGDIEDQADQAPLQGPYATVVMNDCTLFMPLAGLVDVAAERQRLTKNLQKLSQEHQQIQQKLADQNFKTKAPADLVANLSKRLEELNQLIEKLTTTLGGL